MANSALLSFLGFPSWGAIHLLLRISADPEGLSRRLHEARVVTNANVGLLAAFLRCHGDAEPVAHPDRLLAAVPGRSACHPRYRYVIICRPGNLEPLRISAWLWLGPAQGWRRQCGPMPLADYLNRFTAKSPTGKGATGK